MTRRTVVPLARCMHPHGVGAVRARTALGGLIGDGGQQLKGMSEELKGKSQTTLGKAQQKLDNVISG